MACLFARMRYTACHYGQFENLLSVNKTRERRMPLASYARASGALCRNERLGLDARARARDRRVQVALVACCSWARRVGRADCVSLVRSGCRARVASIALVACTARAVRYLSSRSLCRIARDAYLARAVPCGLRLSQVGGCDSHESALAEQLVLEDCSRGAPLARRRRSCI